MPKPGAPVQFLLYSELSRPGVYFLHRNGAVVYVGQARCMRARIGNHLTEGVKFFDAISYIACDVRDLIAIESYYIQSLAPLYNKCSVSKASKKLHRACARKGVAVPSPSGDREFLEPAEAASFLGVTAAAFQEWKRLGIMPRPKSMRQGPSRTRVGTAYNVHRLRRFAEEHPDLIAANKAA
jgi:hypothetical protein